MKKKIGTIHAVLHRCFQNCSNWIKFDIEVVKLINVLKKNGYHENFICDCFKMFIDNRHILNENTPTVQNNLCS